MVKPQEETIQIKVPKEVKRCLAVMAAERGLTQRSIVLLALKGLGIDVSEKEINDRRKGAEK